MHLELLCTVRTPVFGRHQFFGTSEHYGKTHGSLLSGWMNYNYTACCWFPTSSNILILPSQFWQIRFESFWLHCSKCRILVLLRYLVWDFIHESVDFRVKYGFVFLTFSNIISSCLRWLIYTQVHNVIVTFFLCSYILMGCRLSSSFCVSGSEDCTLKVWRLPEDLKEDGNREPVHMKVSFTEKAHDKVIVLPQ